MNDQKIRELLTSYAEEEMSLVHEENMPGYDHIFSDSYKKRIGRMFRSERYSGSKFHFGYKVRRIAVVAIIILSLFTANEVSARVFGFHPWKFVMSFLGDSNMDVKKYKEQTNRMDHTESDVIKRDVPNQIPDGFEEISIKQDEVNLYAEWGAEKQYLQYSRTKLSAEMDIAADGEYQSREKMGIKSFEGDYYVKGNETWLVWDDTCYNHMIMATDVENSKEILMKMAESLYSPV